LSADAAAHQAERFIEQSVAKGRRCVLLIHGRGLHSGPSGPALRPALVEFLRQRPLAKHVLAFTSAPPRHGGAGALLVLLRRR
jgi:DNA-nicking Smr family endonuclease